MRDRFLYPDQGGGFGRDEDQNQNPPDWLYQNQEGGGPYDEDPPMPPSEPPPPPPAQGGNEQRYGYPSGSGGQDTGEDPYASGNYEDPPPPPQEPPRFASPSTEHGTPSGFPAMYDDSEDFAPGGAPPPPGPTGTGQRKVVSMPSTDKNVQLGRGGADAGGAPPPNSGGYDPYASPYDEGQGGYGGSAPPPPPPPDAPKPPQDFEASPEFRKKSDEPDPYAAPQGDEGDGPAGFSAQPPITSDPKYQQLSLGKPGAPAPPPPPAGAETNPQVQKTPDYEQAEGFKPPTIGDLKPGGPPPAPAPQAPYEQPYGGASSETNYAGAGAAMPAYGGGSPYGGQSGEYGQPAGSHYVTGGDGAVDKDGVPTYVPPLPDSYEDDGAMGRKFAGFGWLVVGFLSVLAGFLQGAGPGSFCGAAPFLVVGALMLTGKRWAGIIGLVFTVLMALLFFGAAAITIAAPAVLQELGVAMGGMTLMGIVLAAFASFFIVANLMMLTGGPGKGRATAGALIMIGSFVGLSIFTHTYDIARIGLSNPTGPIEAQTITHNRPQYTFVKPAGWQTYSWLEVEMAGSIGEGGLAVATDLANQPMYYYLNRKQDMMVSFYHSNKPNNLIQLLGSEKMTETEKDFTRELPLLRDPESFIWPQDSEVLWRETIHEGRLQSGPKLRVIVDRADLGDDGYLYVVLTADINDGVKQDELDAAMNGFFSELKF